MKEETSAFQSLLDKADEYTVTSLELVKLKVIDGSVQVASGLIVRLVILSVVLISALMINVSLALFIGDLMGKLYHGFFIVTSINMVLAVVLFLFRNNVRLKSKMDNALFRHLFKATDL